MGREGGARTSPRRRASNGIVLFDRFDRGKLPALKSQERIAVGIGRASFSAPAADPKWLAGAASCGGYGERPGQETRTLDPPARCTMIVAGGVKDGPAVG